MRSYLQAENIMLTYLHRILEHWSYSKPASFVLLGLRLVAGLGMFLHGLKKAPFAMSWAQDSLPAIVQLLVVIIEIGVPLFWFVGFLTPVVSFLLMMIMAGAAGFHMMKGDGFTTQPGYELALMYVLISSVLMVLGPGLFSLDYVFLKKYHIRGKLKLRSLILPFTT